MKPASTAVLLAALLLSQGCRRSAPAPAAPVPSRTCVVTMAAAVGDDAEIVKLQADLRDPRAAARAAEQLGYRFISKARLSNDPGFYTRAEQAAACLAAIRPDDPASLLLRGHVLHQLHRFSEAEAVARRLVSLREFVLDFGLLGDALMEQGRLAEAAEAYQKMIDLKPFYQSYTRAAHLRWLKGDLDGAIVMMNAAVKAASPRSGVGRLGLLAAGAVSAPARPAGGSRTDDRVVSSLPGQLRRCAAGARPHPARTAQAG
jgi:tetratricopeptide (TPR) repeat protein